MKNNLAALTAQYAAYVFLLATLLVYPFSVAATNVFLFLLVLLSCLKIDMIKYGFKVCWFEYRSITIGLILFATLTFIGALWSESTDTVIHKIGKQFKWLIIPAIIGIIHYFPHLRRKSFAALSIGLFLHLIVCSLQDLDVLTINVLGSHHNDATGFLGHLSFGFIYGIWIGALIVAAQNMQKKWAYLCFALALYATITVFLAQGRSGYITTIAILFLVAWKVLCPEKTKLKFTTITLFIFCITLFFTLHTPSQHKLKATISGVEAFFDGNWDKVDMRIKIWATSIELWKDNPWFGIGTGDYKQASIDLLKKPEFAHIRQGNSHFASSHNEFLFNLTRWGPLGLLVTLYLCWAWLSTGWQKDWQQDTMNAYLCTASGLTIILHGLTEVSLNSQLETTFATIILAFSMTKPTPKKQPSHIVSHQQL